MARHTPVHILLRTPHFVVVAKPPHVAVHRSAKHMEFSPMLQRVRSAMGAHVYPIHRLDRPASGCLLFAIEREWAGLLHQALVSPGARKVYVALVRGYFQSDVPVEVSTPMADDNQILKEAHSLVRCLGRSHDPRCSLLRIEPSSGRYHQVRRHVRDLTHPVIGDGDHGDSRVNRHWREVHGLDRLALHALSLSLPLPNGERLEVHCPLFEDQARVYRALPFWSEAVEGQQELGLPPLPMPGAPVHPEVPVASD